MLDGALIGPELAVAFLSVVVRLRNALVTPQDLAQLLADSEVVEPATDDRSSLIGAELLANDPESMSDLSSQRDISR